MRKNLLQVLNKLSPAETPRIIPSLEQNPPKRIRWRRRGGGGGGGGGEGEGEGQGGRREEEEEAGETRKRKKKTKLVEFLGGRTTTTTKKSLITIHLLEPSNTVLHIHETINTNLSDKDRSCLLPHFGITGLPKLSHFQIDPAGQNLLLIVFSYF